MNNIYFLIENGYVINCILLDDPNQYNTPDNILLVKKTTEKGWIGSYYNGQDFIDNPYPSWILNEDKTEFVAPKAKPQDEYEYTWDEQSLSWIKIEPVITSSNTSGKIA